MNIGILHDELGYHTKAQAFYEEILQVLKNKEGGGGNSETNLYMDCLQHKAISLFNLGLYNPSLAAMNEAL